MRLTAIILSAILALTSAHFNVEDYARVYRQKRHEFVNAKHDVIMAEGPYIAARNAYIAATAMLSNAEIPTDKGDPRIQSALSDDDLVGSVESISVEPVAPSARRLKGRKLDDTTVGNQPSVNGQGANIAVDLDTTGDDISGTPVSPSVSAQMEKYSDDYQSAREVWLVAKHHLVLSEGPYLAAREAYLVAANSYTNTLIPKENQPHLWDTIFNKDDYTSSVAINKVQE